MRARNGKGHKSKNRLGAHHPRSKSWRKVQKAIACSPETVVATSDIVRRERAAAGQRRCSATEPRPVADTATSSGKKLRLHAAMVGSA